MSRGYEVNWVSSRTVVHVGDRAELSVDLLGILDAEAMRALLREELARDGWTREDEGALSLERDGVRAELSPDASRVTLTLERAEEVAVGAFTPREAQAELARRASEARDSAQSEVLRALSKVEGDVRAQVDQAVQRTYVAALKQKAASLGTVEGVQESRREDGGYEVTIRVRT
jgi:hypothetical protein